MNQIDELFEFWKQQTSHTRAHLGDQRRKKITRAFRYGYTLEDLKLAVLGCKRSNFHQGHNDRQTVYDDIELICRDEMHIDKFIQLGEQVERCLRTSNRAAEERAHAIEHKTPMPDEMRRRIKSLLRRVS